MDLRKLLRTLKKRKGAAGVAINAILGLALIIIIASVLIRVTSELKLFDVVNDETGNETIGSHHTAVNTTAQYGIDALVDLAEQVPLLGLIMIFGIIILSVLLYLMPVSGGGSGSYRKGGGKL